jgi:phosphatidylserine synthase
MKILNKLSTADYISLTALLFAWLAVIALITNHPERAIYFSVIAFICDLTDGYVARATKKFSDIGVYLDTHVDVFVYLVFSAFMLLNYLSNTSWYSVIVAFILVASGILRLIRFTKGGILKRGKREYYVGFPVYFPYFYVIYSYLLSRILDFSLGIASNIILLALSYLMISEVKSIKTRNPLILGFIILSIMILNYYAHH